MAANVNSDLVRERENATFDVNKLSYIIYGGKDKLERKQEIGKYFHFTCLLPWLWVYSLILSTAPHPHCPGPGHGLTRASH